MLKETETVKLGRSVVSARTCRLENRRSRASCRRFLAGAGELVATPLAHSSAPNSIAPKPTFRLGGDVKLTKTRFDLQLAHRWTIARGLEPGGTGGTNQYHVVLVELQDAHGIIGRGEAAPSSRYEENVDSVLAFLGHVDPAKLSFADVPGSMRYLDSISQGQHCAKGSLNIALLDGAGKKAGKPIYDLLGLGFTENKHVTSFSIGIDVPDVIRAKVAEAADYPVLKLKVGSPEDEKNLAALRSVAPTKPVRVDANEAWKTREEALQKIEWLARDGHIQFIEQPMPASSNPKDMAWLKERSPLPVMGDESCVNVHDVSLCADCFHSVNVKLVKTGGISGAFDTLSAARRAGLKTMLGCMIESSVLISAAASLAELTDYLDIDGNLLITNDPFAGPTAVRGQVSYRPAQEQAGLRVRPRQP